MEAYTGNENENDTEVVSSWPSSTKDTLLANSHILHSYVENGHDTARISGQAEQFASRVSVGIEPISRQWHIRVLGLMQEPF
jgi:hypothetical protein